MRKIGILVGPKGRGSNMAAIHEACRSGRLKAEVALVAAPSADAPALHRAREAGLAVRAIPYDTPDFGAALADAFGGCDVLCLAGYLRLVPPEVLRAFPDRVLNIHPALLPKFGGKGMYGLRVHQAVIEAGESESGCTVHLVNERYDEGRTLVQRRVPVLPGDTAETLAARVLEQEHLAYPEAIELVLASLD